MKSYRANMSFPKPEVLSARFKTVFCVPSQETLVWKISGIVGQTKPLPIKAAIFISVVENRPNSVADHKAEVIINHRVTGIKHAVNISPQKNTVRSSVLPSFGIGLDMRRLQSRQNSAICQRALVLVGFDDRDPERSLSQARQDQMGATETFGCLSHTACNLMRRQKLIQFVPEGRALWLPCRERLAANNVSRPG